MFNEIMSSSHRKDYILLSFKFFTTPKHVYDLSHGKDAQNARDQKILNELCELGIIHRHRKHRHHIDDSE